VNPRAIEFDKLKKKRKYLIGIRTRDLPACSIQPHPTTLSSAHYKANKDKIKGRIEKQLEEENKQVNMKWQIMRGLNIYRQKERKERGN
jgi:hypothetical protein